MTNDQKLAFNKFSKLKVGALFMEMGTGKTKTALELINYNSDKIDLVLWFTPFSTKKNLQNEIEKWGISTSFDIIGYETIQSSDKKYLDLLEKIENKAIFTVADESIFIKNNETKRYKRINDIGSKSQFRLILNGTPISKDEYDIYNQMNFLSPLIFSMNEHEFKSTFYDKIIYKKKGEKQKQFWKLSNENTEHFHKLIDPYIFKCDFIFNKKEIVNKIYINPTRKTLKNYDDIKNNILENLQEYSSEAIIVLLQKLNIISSTDKNKSAKIAQYSKNKRLIIFCQYIEELNNIKANLENYYEIKGDTKKEDRTMILKEFEINEVPLLITYGTGSFGLNLQFCNEIVFSSISLDYSKIIQAKARIKRLGQTDDIKYNFFELDLPINKFIQKNIEKKENLADLLIKELNGKII